METSCCISRPKRTTTIPAKPSPFEKLKAAIAALDLANFGVEFILVSAPSPASKKRIAQILPIDAQLGTALKRACSRALEDARSRKSRKFDPRANPTRDEALYAVDNAIDDSARLFSLLKNPKRDPIGAHAAEWANVKLYAVAFGTGEQRMFFIQRRVETISGGGKLITRYFGDQMSLVTEPTLVLPTGFEALLHPLGVVVLHGGDIFERLFRDDKDIAAEVKTYVTQFSAQIPLDQTSLDALTSAIKPLYMRKRAKSVLADPRFKSLDVARIELGCKHQNIDLGVFFEQKQVRLTPDNVVRFVKFLNNEVYRGEFNNELLAADGTAPF